MFVLLALCHLAASRQLLVRISPDDPSVTVPYSLPKADSAHSPLGYIPDVGLWVLAPENPGIEPQQVRGGACPHFIPTAPVVVLCCPLSLFRDTMVNKRPGEVG